MADTPAPLEISVTSGDGWICVAPIGELDHSNTDLLDRASSAAEAIDRELRLNCAEISFIDSAGLRCLMLHHRRGAQILEPSPPVVRMFELTGLYEVLMGR